jgi:hypothetical protein
MEVLFDMTVYRYSEIKPSVFVSCYEKPVFNYGFAPVLLTNAPKSNF